ncbi:hypothetical protein LINPERPRIM_LOCUS1093 [Linum perenne]
MHKFLPRWGISWGGRSKLTLTLSGLRGENLLEWLSSLTLVIQSLQWCCWMEYPSLSSTKTCLPCVSISIELGIDSKECPDTISVVQTSPTDPQGTMVRATASATPPPESYGPWMVVSRRQSRPRKESYSHKESRDLKLDAGKRLEGNQGSKKEGRDQGTDNGTRSEGNQGSRKESRSDEAAIKSPSEEILGIPKERNPSSRGDLIDKEACPSSLQQAS